MKTLGEIGEDELIHRLVKLVPISVALGEGPGDDCAVVDSGGEMLTLLKTDALVEGVHYEKTADPRSVGWKAVARVISDFAAMGGRPGRFLVTIALPGSADVAWVESFYRGMGDCLGIHGGLIAGGETCRVPEGSAAVISIAATGFAERGKVVFRSGGNIGDEIWVTGQLGGSISGKHLSFSPRVEESAWLIANAGVSAMMDLSDGIAKDLPRLAAASACGFEILRENIPASEGCTLEQALTDGEDFELLFTAPAGRISPEDWGKEFPSLRLTKIGSLVAAGEGDALSGGWDHFATRH
jgi:thiamine-monophosphate kinase